MRNKIIFYARKRMENTHSFFCVLLHEEARAKHYFISRGMSLRAQTD